MPSQGLRCASVCPHPRPTQRTEMGEVEATLRRFSQDAADAATVLAALGYSPALIVSMWDSRTAMA